MSTQVTMTTSTLGQVWACLAAASGRALRQRLATGPAWDMICLELLDARDYLERFDPAAARAAQNGLPDGDPLELVRQALDLLEDADPFAHGVGILALRVRVRRLEQLLAPDPESV